MRFPNYESYEPASHQPLDGYIMYVGRRNSQDPYTSYAPQTKQHAAALLAQGCTQLTVEQNPRLAKKTFLEARRLSLAAEENKSADNESTLGLSGLINAIAFRNQKKLVAQTRESLHVDVMEALDVTLQRFTSHQVQSSSREGLKKIYRGEVNHLTTLGLFTRYGAHPWIGAWPLAYHHAPQDELVDTSRNIDVVLAETMPSMEVPEVYGLQIKGACMGFCGKERPTHFKDPRASYDPEVILVSAECDLGYNPVNRRHDFPTAHLLRSEYEGTITPDELSQLDRTANDLLLAITEANEQRRGTLSLAV